MAKNFYKYIYKTLSAENIANGKIFVSDTVGEENLKQAPYVFITEISEKIHPNIVRSARFQIDIFGKNIEETHEIREKIIKIFHKKTGQISSEMIESHGISGVGENLVRAIVDFRFVTKETDF